MSLTLTYLGHAGVLLEDDKHAVAIDPFLTGNPLAVKKAADIRCKHVVVTHGHDDHLGDAAAIASANKGTVYANYEITRFLAGQGVATEAGNPGGKLKTDFGWIAFTQALHSSSG